MIPNRSVTTLYAEGPYAITVCLSNLNGTSGLAPGSVETKIRDQAVVDALCTLHPEGTVFKVGSRGLGDFSLVRVSGVSDRPTLAQVLDLATDGARAALKCTSELSIAVPPPAGSLRGYLARSVGLGPPRYSQRGAAEAVRLASELLDLPLSVASWQQDIGATSIGPKYPAWIRPAGDIQFDQIACNSNWIFAGLLFDGGCRAYDLANAHATLLDASSLGRSLRTIKAARKPQVVVFGGLGHSCVGLFVTQPSELDQAEAALVEVIEKAAATTDARLEQAHLFNMSEINVGAASATESSSVHRLGSHYGEGDTGIAAEAVVIKPDSVSKILLERPPYDITRWR